MSGEHHYVRLAVTLHFNEAIDLDRRALEVLRSLKGRERQQWVRDLVLRSLSQQSGASNHTHHFVDDRDE